MKLMHAVRHGRTRPGQTWRRATVLGAVAAAIAGASAASAASPTGGFYPSPTPVVSGISCRSDCAAIDAARTGSLARVRGRNLRTIVSVVFLGGRGTADDVTAKPERATDRAVDVRVPRGAVTGPVKVLNRDGAASRRSRRTLTVGRVSTGARPVGDPSTGPPVDARVATRKVFFGSERGAQLAYMVQGDQPASVSVELVRAEDGASIARWGPLESAPGVTQTVEWDGKAGGRVQREGRYEFRLYTGAPGTTPPGATASQATPPQVADSFLFLRHKFPIRGKHEYGEGAGRFGAGRGGRRHQGQDVFAACGTPLVAARGGIVEFKQYHSRAGNYIVIDGEATGVDYAYMHMRDPALVNKGDRVYTGQLIGYVGDSGVADGCHLHIELWSAPGWYSGGSPFDPLPALQAWDAQS